MMEAKDNRAIKVSSRELLLCEAARKAGIREVVEYIDDHPLIYSPSGEDFDRVVKEWESQKKKWGIE